MSQLLRGLPNAMPDTSLFILLIVAFATSIAARLVYLLWFHPLSGFPGPRIAAVSDVWYAYHWLSGRWPWAIENALKQYGDVVRIAPNELVFVRPQALADIYTSHVKYHESFAKTDINERGEKHNGFIWERDPVRHRKVAKQMSPAFSGRALNAKEPTLHKHVDFFVQRMKAIGGCEEGIRLDKWMNWLAVDLSGDMAYNNQMHAMRDSTDPKYLSVLLGFNRCSTIIQVSRRFPFLAPLKYMFLPMSVMRSFAEIRETAAHEVYKRLNRKTPPEHLDFFEQDVPESFPTDPDEIRHLEQVAAQLLFAGYEPTSVWFYGTLFHLVHATESLDIVTNEIRRHFTTYDNITTSEAAALPYLTACLKESLRLFSNTINGMPVFSPGAMVDGTYIPKGVRCQTSTFALARSPRNFRDPLLYKPQRWLPHDHRLFEPKFANDNTEDFFPFSQGPRACAGKEIAWRQSRLFIAKVLWTFDIALIPGHSPIVFDRDLKAFGWWEKPQLNVRFSEARR
ncbi:cytochrome P450 [Xylariomycetidae sp. FL2044]|nr:cytochrome P450 [Xylariomycetidae sp. FL2044]